MASTRLPNTSRPLHEELRRLRTTSYTPESILASSAGCTVGTYRAMELGQIPMSKAVYEAALGFFPQLKAYKAPAADPTPIVATMHPAIALEYQRLEEFLTCFKQLNMGSTNKKLVRHMLLLAASGQATPEDIERLFG